MPEIGPGKNFFGRAPGPFPIGPGQTSSPEFPSRNGFLQIQLVRRPRSIGTKVVYKLYPPQVVTQPPVVAGPLGSLVLQVPRRATHYRLSAPAVVTPVAQPPVVTTILKSLADQRLRIRTISKLGAPVVVTPAPPVATTLRVKLAPQPRQGRQSGYGLAAPAIVDLPPAQPVKVTLARRKVVRRPVLYKLRQPAVLSTPTVFVPFAIQTHLAKWRRPRPTVHQLRLGLTATATVEVHDCRKTLLTDATGVFGTLALASGTQGNLSLSSGSQGSLVDSGGTHGTLAETSTTKGDLTDTC